MSNKILKVLLALYTISLIISTAGMEIFGWLFAVVGGVYATVKTIKAKKSVKVSQLTIGADLAIWGMFIAAIVAGLVNAPSGSSWENMLGEYRWIVLFYALVLLIRGSHILENNQRWFRALIFLAGIVGLYGVLQSFTGIDIQEGSYSWHRDGVRRSSGFFGMPLTFGYAMGMFLCFPLSAIILRLWRTKAELLLYIFSSTTLFLSVLFSMTRGAWVSIFVTIFSLILVSKKWKYVFLVGGIFLAGGLVASKNSMISERLTEALADPEKAMGGRYYIWLGNIEIFKDYPLFGIGHNENGKSIAEYYKKIDAPPETLVGSHAHNNYIQFLAGTGAVGLICFLFFIFYFFRLSIQMWRKLPTDQTYLRVLILGAIGAQINMHVGGLTECTFADLELTHIYLFILVIVTTISSLKVSENKNNYSKSQTT